MGRTREHEKYKRFTRPPHDNPIFLTMMSSIPTMTATFLVGALVLVAVGGLVCICAQLVRRTLSRRVQLRKELSGDWWSRFEQDFHTYVGDRHRRGLHQRAPE